MIDLNKEVQEYYNDNIDQSNIPREHYEKEIIELMSDFVVDSKYVQQQILQAKIDVVELICNKYYIQLYDELAELNKLRSNWNKKLKEL